MPATTTATKKYVFTKHSSNRKYINGEMLYRKKKPQAYAGVVKKVYF
jgi:hypothetical protein